MDASLTMILFGTLIFFGFLTNYLFSYTKIPDSLILIALGLLLSYAGVLDSTKFLGFANLAASVAIAVILFDAGLNTDIESMLKGLAPAFYLGVLGFFVISLILAGIFHVVLGYSLLLSLLVGFSLGGSSAAIVIPMASSLKLDQTKITLLSLESTITNILEIVFGLSFAQLIMNASADMRAALNLIFSSLSIGIVLGLLVGYAWIRILRSLRGKPYAYMLTLGTLFILYGFTEMVGGSGALASLAFGFILGNSKEITQLMHLPKVSTTKFAQFHDEISFLIRTYFFLFLGTVLKLPENPSTWAIALLATLGIIVGRALAVLALKLDRDLITFIPRGLNEAVLAVLYTTMGIPHASDILLTISLIIILTNLFTAPLMLFSEKVESGEDNGEKGNGNKGGNNLKKNGK